jgi:uncharacterized protein (DUF1697 family)
MNDFALSVVLGLCFGFLFGIGCALAVMHAIYRRGYRKAVADSLEPAKPRIFRQALKKIEERRGRKALPAPIQPEPEVQSEFGKARKEDSLISEGVSGEMTAYIALLRAVNVLGTGKVKMTDLKAMCEAAGFRSVRTYIASGNVVFQSDKTEAHVKSTLEAALATYAGKHINVLVRTAAEIAAVLSRNPFSKMPGNRTVAFFLDGPPASDALQTVSKQDGEQLRLGQREIYVYYANGIGNSRIKIPAAKDGTARNMNTIAKLAAMAAEHQSAPTA